MLIGVVAHVSRDALSTKLSDSVGANFRSVDQSWPPSVNGCADNHIKVWQTLKQLATQGEWCVVLEDDALPVFNFRQELKRALLKVDTSLVGLYLGTGSPDGHTQCAIAPAVEAAKSSDAAWITSDWFISTVGYVVRSELLSDMISTVSELGGPVDNRINDWSQSAGLKTWYCQPSLVNHYDESSTLTQFQFHPRHAHRYGTRAEWNSGTVEMGYAYGWSQQ